MNGTDISHVGFSDESHWKTGRYRSLGLVTATLAAAGTLESALDKLLHDASMGEFKWNWLTGAKERFAGEAMCRFAVEKACAGLLRVDVLVWDVEDSRHRVPGRDDIANLQIMYYKLFRNVLRARWPSTAVWRLHPDQMTALDWETVQDCLGHTAKRVGVDGSLFTNDPFRVRLRREFGIEQIRPLASGDSRFIQLADLFAGLAVFSREKYSEYEDWKTSRSGQLALLGVEGKKSAPSRISQERFRVLDVFDGCCKARKLGVSLKTYRGLQTPNPVDPLNFWLYKPQHEADKAPQKGRQQ